MSTSIRHPLTIVITGASRGLGAGMARSFLDKGYKVALCSRSDGPSDLVSSSSSSSDNTNKNTTRTYYESGIDVSDENSIETFLQNVLVALETPLIDVWINNAGIIDPIQPIRDISGDDFVHNIHINLCGVFYATKAYINHVRDATTNARSSTSDSNSSSSSHAPTLINISSGAAVQGYAGWGAYCSAKAGVDRLTECVYLEEHNEHTNFLRAYSMAPGVIDTSMQEKIRACDAADFPMVQKFLQIKDNEHFNSSSYVASQIETLFLRQGEQKTQLFKDVVQRIPNEK